MPDKTTKQQKGRFTVPDLRRLSSFRISRNRPPINADDAQESNANVTETTNRSTMQADPNVPQQSTSSSHAEQPNPSSQSSLPAQSKRFELVIIRINAVRPTLLADRNHEEKLEVYNFTNADFNINVLARLKSLQIICILEESIKASSVLGHLIPDDAFTTVANINCIPIAQNTLLRQIPHVLSPNYDLIADFTLDYSDTTNVTPASLIELYHTEKPSKYYIKPDFNRIFTILYPEPERFLNEKPNTLTIDIVNLSKRLTLELFKQCFYVSQDIIEGIIGTAHRYLLLATTIAAVNNPQSTLEHKREILDMIPRLAYKTLHAFITIMLKHIDYETDTTDISIPDVIDFDAEKLILPPFLACSILIFTLKESPLFIDLLSLKAKIAEVFNGMTKDAREISDMSYLDPDQAELDIQMFTRMTGSHEHQMVDMLYWM